MNKFTRRQILKSLGATGLLSSVQINKSLAATEQAPVRVLCVALQHGWGLAGGSNRFMQGTLDEFSFPDGLDPFNTIKSQCNVVDGLLTLGQWGNNHDLSYADILTAGVLVESESSDYDSHMPMPVNASIDYLLQEASGKPAFRFSAGYRSWGVQYHPLSFDHDLNVLPYYTTAKSAYDSIFKDLQNGGSLNLSAADQREAQIMQNVFNFIKTPANEKSAVLNSKEQQKLNQYILAVEHVENKTLTLNTYSGSERVVNIPEAGQSKLTDLDHYLEMIKVGFANDLTRSAVLGIGDIIDIADFHHEHAHGNTNTYWDTRRTYAQAISKFVTQLEKVTDFDGRPLIDNTIIVLTGEVGDGTHGILDKGNIVIGGGAHIQTGRYLKQTIETDRNVVRNLKREDINGDLVNQIRWSDTASTRTNADLFREIGNIAGLELTQFGLPSQNKGNVLI
ncbi:DUF1552 domain-containing protein [Marinicellulosiphila megalodicopiae]|uniref:DUF1552 domain-containing protein n=1 Tax=Marinicellulosiphila megalodicopiae TaxID=2724896 RepID=UPI003BAF1F36